MTVSWLSAWLSDQRDLGPLDNSAIVCRHNKLDPDKFKEYKLVSSKVVCTFRTIYLLYLVLFNFTGFVWILMDVFSEFQF